MNMFIVASAVAVTLGAGAAASCSRDQSGETESYAPPAQEESMTGAPADSGQSQAANSGQQMAGAKVYDTNGRQIGVIQEVTIASDGTEVAIMSAGEYLGIGGQQLSVATNELSPMADGSGYSVPVTAEAIEASASQQQGAAPQKQKQEKTPPKPEEPEEPQERG